MKTYYRPIPQTDTARPAEARPIAGGWCWFDHAEVLRRDGYSDIVHINQIPNEVVQAVSEPRASIAGLSFEVPRIMGILNVTPDSFSDGGKFDAPEVALARANAMVQEGADILDIGGESTRPGADTVDPEVEIARTSPVIQAIRKGLTVLISIDTRKRAVAQAALQAGADMVNDVAAFTYDRDLAALVAAAHAPVCLMHALGDPKTMQQSPEYENVLLDVYDFLSDRIEMAVAAGIPPSQIIVDPGIGFGKTEAHNLTLLRGLGLFHALGCVVLVGASRKRLIGTIGNAPIAADRTAGSISVALHAVRQGVQLVRVHDIRETRQALSLTQAVIGSGDRV